MRGGEIASREHEVVHIARIQRTIRNRVGFGEAALLEMFAVLGLQPEAAGQVVVDLPAAVGDGVLELCAAVLHVLLGHCVVAHVTATFAFAGQEAEPFHLPVVRAMFAVVLHVVPHAEGDLEKLVAGLLRVADAVRFAA